MSALATPPAGLTAAEVEQRRRDGRGNTVPRPPSRTVLQILRANVFTPFNALLGAMFVLVVAVAPLQDATFGFVIVANTLVGTVQEVRAKRTLDRLSILNAPTARVVRDGAVTVVAAADVVADDVVVLGPGDQLPVDATVVEADGLELDESLVTGEAEPQHRAVGDAVLSGSFVVAGGGRAVATRVGAASFAADLTEQARRFSVARSPLQLDVNRVLRWVAIALVPAAALLIRGQVAADLGFRRAAARSVAGVVTLVPEGLVLLTSVAFAVGVIRLGQRRCLVKELPAVELLARVSVVCVDKTGTLTAGAITFDRIEPLAGADEALVRAALVAVAAGDPSPNATMRALAEVGGDPAASAWAEVGRVGFSSARKWSAASFDGVGTFVIGAPELLSSAAFVLDRTAAVAGEGARVVLLARTDAALHGEDLPAGLVPLALVVLSEQLRPDAADTIRYFTEQGVVVKVISGDNPETVAAIAARVGVPHADRAVDARTLPDDVSTLAAAVDAAAVFGRVTPQQKRAMVGALQAAGHVVAMTGDGVNDVLALKDADLGVAMGQGSAATRAVAQVVLLDNAFASLPAVVAEGRRVIANVERVAGLFLTKTVAALWMAAAVGVLGMPYPFLPRHLTLLSATAIGIPGFFLALGPARERARGSFLRRVASLVAVTGTAAAVAALGAFGLTYGLLDRGLVEAQTAATAAMSVVMLVVLALVARPLERWKRLLVAAMAALVVSAFVLPPARRFFEFDVLAPTEWAVTAGAAAAGVAVLALLRVLPADRR